MTWKTSSFTNGGGACVEVACRSACRHIRDSKHRVHGKILSFPVDSFSRLVRGL